MMKPFKRRTILKSGSAALLATGITAGTFSASIAAAETTVSVEVEGELTSVNASGDTISVMDIEVNVPADATISSPTATGLSLEEIGDGSGSFPGRNVDGFLGGTAAVEPGEATGTDGDFTVTAEELFVEVAENVTLGPVTANGIPDGGDLGDGLFEVLDLEVQPVGDSRMPYTGATLEGLDVDLGTVPVDTLTVVEGHRGNDGVIYVHTLETTGGNVPGDQTSITRAKCDGDDADVEFRGASTATSGEVEFFDDDSDEFLGEADLEEEPELGIGVYRFRDELNGCPETVRVENLENGSTATAEVTIG